MPGQEEKFRSQLQQAFWYADQLACPRIHVFAGLVTGAIEGTSVADMSATYVNNLRYAAPLSKEKGITIVLEPISPVAIPHYFLNLTSQAAALIAQVNEANVRLQLDLYHAQMTHGNLANTLKENIAIIDHIQISNCPGKSLSYLVLCGLLQHWTL